MIYRVSDEIKAVSLANLARYIGNDGLVGAFLSDAGVEQYKLLATLATQAHAQGLTRAIDIGTFFGSSALALSLAGSSVLTIDTTDWMGALDLPPSIIRLSGDGTAVVPHRQHDAAIVSLDIDPHSGLAEQAYVRRLLRRGYDGLLLCDDISVNDGMEAFWEWAGTLPEVRLYDATKWGHWSGTGLIAFGDTKVEFS